MTAAPSVGCTCAVDAWTAWISPLPRHTYPPACTYDVFSVFVYSWLREVQVTSRMGSKLELSVLGQPLSGYAWWAGNARLVNLSGLQVLWAGSMCSEDVWFWD